MAGTNSFPWAEAGPLVILQRYMRPQGGRVLFLGVCLVLGVFVQLLGPQILSRFIDTAARTGATAALPQLWHLAALFLLATVIAQALRLAGVYLGSRVGWGATNLLRHDLAAHCLGLDMGFHDEHSPGVLIERLDGDVSTLASFFSQFTFQILGGTLLLAGILVVLTTRDFRVGLGLGLFALLALAVLHRTRRLGVPHFAAERERRAELAGFIEERLGGLDDVRANGGGLYVMARLGGLNGGLTTAGVRAVKVAQIFIVVITNGVFIAGYGLALGLGIWLFQGGRATLGSVYLIVQYAAMMRAPLEAIGAQAADLQRAMASLSRVHELLATNLCVRDGADAHWPGGPATVGFHNVDFAYGGAPAVLHGVTFQLEAGTTLGLLGRTGSGKTTVARLLSRLYDPTSGEITVGGRDIRRAGLADLRAQVGVVSQDVRIFRASLRDNLTWFDPQISDRRLIDLLGDLGLDPWLSRLPQGLDSVLTGDLSAGEAQLIAFARVFLADPGVVVLDEASARLDPVTERLTDRALDALLAGGGTGRCRTAIVIAHRLATVARLDRILIMEAGEVVEHGERAALAADPQSRFASLLRGEMTKVLA